MANDGNYKKNKIGKHALKPETMMMSYGYNPQLSEGSVKPPVFLTSTFAYQTPEEGTLTSKSLKTAYPFSKVRKAPLFVLAAWGQSVPFF
jgi:cystathionine beta-lyase/cystathionine gamma-synthase